MRASHAAVLTPTGEHLIHRIQAVRLLVDCLLGIFINHLRHLRLVDTLRLILVTDDEHFSYLLWQCLVTFILIGFLQLPSLLKPRLD